MATETLICECGDDKNHVQYVDKNKDTVITCTVCEMFLKQKDKQPGIPETTLDAVKEAKKVKEVGADKIKEATE